MEENNNKAAKRTRIMKIMKWSVLTSLLAGICILFYGCQEAGKLECNSFELPAQSLPGMDGLKIAHLTDIHSNLKLLTKAVDMVMKENPDLVIITGDFIDANGRTSKLRLSINQLQRLSNKFPTYACYGNHDMEKFEIAERMLRNSNIKVLRNEQTIFHSKRLQKDLIIAGVGSWLEYDCFPDQCLIPQVDGKNADTLPVLLLCHNVYARHELTNYSWNLMLAGHTHGNQIRNPFTQKALFYRNKDHYTEGHLQMGDHHLFISRGIASAWGLRFFCPPEINILTIK